MKKILILSTAHIRPTTQAALHGKNITVLSSPTGFILRVPTAPDRNFMPDEIRSICEKIQARRPRVDFLMFDKGANMSCDFPTYTGEWLALQPE